MINGVNTYSNANFIKNYPQKHKASFSSNNKTTSSTKDANTKNKPVNTSIFYVNDIHGRITNMYRIKTMHNLYMSNKPKADIMNLASGDIMVGADDNTNIAATMFLNSIGVTATALGNHEFDMTPEQLAKNTQNAKFKLLGINLRVDENNDLHSRLEKSFVQEVNGNKYAIIGIAPPDLYERIRGNSSRDKVKVDDFEKTIKDVQNEVKKYREQGINKIIVLSHCGMQKDQRLAKEIEDIDIILGAHTHELFEGIKEGVNLFYSKKGEPVIITQAGENGMYAGFINVEFNDKGVITKAQNNIYETKQFKRDIPLRKAFDIIYGPPEKLGVIAHADPPPKRRLVDPNPHMYFIMDAVRSEMGVDLALINAGNIRDYFEAGPIDSRQLFEIVPLKNKVVVHDLSEPELVQALKNGAKSYIHPGFKPSIVIPSGLKYTVTTKGEIKSATYIDKDGKQIPIDINNPNPNKIYKVASDDFFASGGDNLIGNKMAEGKIDKVYDFDKVKLTCDYIKKLNRPIDIKDDGRITVIN